MPYYTTFGILQSELRSYYREHGAGLQFPEVIHAMYVQGKLSEKPIQRMRPFQLVSNDGNAQFEALVDEISFSITPGVSTSLSECVYEGSVIPAMRDVFVIRHPRYTRPYLHRHDYVEVDCVVEGRCRLHFEDEVQELEAGTLCFIAPDSNHDIEVTGESTVYCFMLRRSTFETTFFSLLSREDALALFFRTILQGDREPNYLIFQSDRLLEVRMMAQNAMLECYKSDSYSNSCCISYVNLLFAAFLRTADTSPRYYHYQMSSNFYLVLQYIRYHYRDLTLAQLAEEFHYSKPHLCTLIKQNTGVSFTNLLKQIRMTRAAEYLLRTELPVGKIAEIVGYHSADHFSRTFRSAFDCAPQEYRRRHAEDAERFIPFEMK